MELGKVLGLTGRDELVAYTTSQSLATVAKERMAAQSVAMLVAWAHGEALAALSGKGVTDCPYCAALRKQAQASGVTLPADVPVFDWDLPYPDRGGKFRGGKGVRNNADHLSLHLNRAADALFAERQARRLAKATKTEAGSALKQAADGIGWSEARQLKKARREARLAERKLRDHARSKADGCGKKKH
jgi:hypothetical protein